MKLFSFVTILSIGFYLSFQHSYNDTGFDEPEDPSPAPASEWVETEPGFHTAFGSIDERYEYHSAPSTTGEPFWNGTAWKGERVNIQLKIWSKEPIRNIRVSNSDLVNENGGVINKDLIEIHPVRFVLTDEFLSGCGYRDHDTIPAHLGSDLLENNQEFHLEEKTLRPVWLTLDVPADAVPGNYEGAVTISYEGGEEKGLPIELNVYDLKLPEPADWSFHLDLWQNPYAIARYYEVKPWSGDHLELLQPYLEMLADAGQKVITASILHQPWGAQTYDPFESMIEWIYLGDGRWDYDYSIFDKWIRINLEAGITQQINSYSMVPWGNQVRYYDQSEDDYITKTIEPGSQEYVDVWTPFLINFRDHLKGKGWLDKTLISMDERSLDEMESMLNLVQEVTPEFNIALAGSYLEEINDELYDLSVQFSYDLDKTLIKNRVENGWPTTFYTSCAPPEHPNSFTFSPPAEQEWIGWHAASKGYTGFLRWAYNSWVEDPLKDSRFRTWSAGDTYQIYPGPRSSIRFERLREGIQAFEKIKILRTIAENHDSRDRLEELDYILEQLTLEEIQRKPAEYWLNEGKRVLNDLSKWAADLP